MFTICHDHGSIEGRIISPKFMTCSWLQEFDGSQSCLVKVPEAAVGHGRNASNAPQARFLLFIEIHSACFNQSPKLLPLISATLFLSQCFNGQ
jgi:hypothetical protein